MKRKLKRIKYLIGALFIAGLIGGGYSVQNTSSQRDATCASYRTGHAVLLGTLRPVQAQETPEKTEAEKINEFGLLLFGEEDWKLMQRIIKCESNWRTAVISSTQDVGLTQINMPAHKVPARFLTDPYVNLSIAKTLWDASGATPWRSSYKCHGIR